MTMTPEQHRLLILDLLTQACNALTRGGQPGCDELASKNVGRARVYLDELALMKRVEACFD